MEAGRLSSFFAQNRAGSRKRPANLLIAYGAKRSLVAIYNGQILGKYGGSEEQIS
ncbi:MAG TPA: hypothetical protein VEJ67_03755 [Candidatus Cybelea sp.]|nr:hypothetical protein [Candidatus Cybelea sp.]